MISSIHHSQHTTSVVIQNKTMHKQTPTVQISSNLNVPQSHMNMKHVFAITIFCCDYINVFVVHFFKTTLRVELD